MSMRQFSPCFPQGNPHKPYKQQHFCPALLSVLLSVLPNFQPPNSLQTSFPLRNSPTTNSQMTNSRQMSSLSMNFPLPSSQLMNFPLQSFLSSRLMMIHSPTPSFRRSIGPSQAPDILILTFSCFSFPQAFFAIHYDYNINFFIKQLILPIYSHLLSQ